MRVHRRILLMNRITDNILYKVEKPARYIGGELNEIIKDLDDIDSIM